MKFIISKILQKSNLNKSVTNTYYLHIHYMYTLYTFNKLYTVVTLVLHNLVSTLNVIC